jgi:hypothetical protein
MKKNLLLGLTALLALSLAFTACSKDDDDSTPDVLTGTEWVAEDEDDMFKFYVTEFEISSEHSHYTGTYVYQKPVVEFKFSNGRTNNTTINGNKMIFSSTSYHQSLVYIRTK